MRAEYVLPRLALAVLVALFSALLAQVVFALIIKPLMLVSGAPQLESVAFAGVWIACAWLMTRRTTTNAQLVRRLEIVVVIGVTLSILPTLLLYGIDLLARTPSPGAGWAVAMVGAVAALWSAVLRRFPLSPRTMSGWLTTLALAAAVVLLAYNIWGSARAGGLNFSSAAVEVAAIAVAIRHILDFALRTNRAAEPAMGGVS
jgi:hypothetical protein